MFDDLQEHRRVISVEAKVAVEQGAVDEFDAVALVGRQPVAAFSRAAQCAVRNLHAQDFCELGIIRQDLREAALPATEVENALRAALF